MNDEWNKQMSGAQNTSPGDSFHQGCQHREPTPSERIVEALASVNVCPRSETVVTPKQPSLWQRVRAWFG